MGQINKQNQNQETTNIPELLGDQSQFDTTFSVQYSMMRQLLDALTSRVNALIAAIDVNYHYIYFSQAYSDEVKRLVGINLKIGMTVMDVYRDRREQLAFTLKQWNRALGGEFFKEVVRFLRTQAETGENFYEATYSPIEGDKGIISGAVLVASNITRRQKLEHSLAESEMRYQQLFDHIFDGLAICEFVFDKKGHPIDYRILDVNPNFTKMVGSERGQIVGSTYSASAPSLNLLGLDRVSQLASSSKSIHFEGYSSALQRTYEVSAYLLAKHSFAIILSDITERKVETENVNWLASFPEQNPMPVLEIDYDRKITYQNPAAHKVFPDLSIKDQSEQFVLKIKDVVDQFRTEAGLINSKDMLIGNVWMHLSFYNMRQRERIRIYSIDITDRVNAEKELLDLNRKLEETVQLRTEELSKLNQELNQDILRRVKSEKALETERKRFNDVLQVLPVYVILLNPDGHINFSNKYFKDYFHKSNCVQRDELSYYRNGTNEVEETFKPLENGKPNLWEWSGPENRIYAIHDYPFMDVDGSQLILEMGVDITEIRTTQKELIETSNYNRSLIEANLDFLVTINQNGIIGDVNAAAENATGLNRDELIGTRFENYFDDPDAANRGLQLVLETGSVRNYELNLKHKDGHVIPVAYNASFYKNLQGEIVGIFAGARELTDIKRKETQLLELNHALEESIKHEAEIHDQLVQSEKFAAMGRLLASVTHEINNPLQTISNCLYLISSDIPAQSQASQFLEMAVSETARISKLVAELKEAYRPHHEDTFAPVHLPTLLDEIFQLIKPQLKEKHVEWNLRSDSVSTTELWVNGVADQIRQVFINLSTNAIEAMQPNGGLLKVNLAKGKNNQTGVLFSDSGPGIDPKIINRIFEPFYSTKNQGLGLGLSICYDIIQRHNGYIEVSSIPGKGSTFEVWFPGYEAQKLTER